MAVTLVLRLLHGPLALDELVGYAEIVATGESRPIRGLADLLAVARAASMVGSIEDVRGAPGPDHSAPPILPPTSEAAP